MEPRSRDWGLIRRILAAADETMGYEVDLSRFVDEGHDAALVRLTALVMQDAGLVVLDVSELPWDGLKYGPGVVLRPITWRGLDVLEQSLDID